MVSKNINPKVENPKKLQCPICGKTKLLRFFYKSKDPRFAMYGGYCYYCKDCLKDKCFLPNGIPDKNGFKTVLKEYLNLPFYDELYRKSLDNDKDTLGFYISQLNIAKKGANLTWEDGETEENDSKVKSIKTLGILDEKEVQELALKWGEEWNQEELLLLEQTYKELGADKNLKYNSSKQYLKLATMNYVRSYTAMKQGNVQDAEKYTKLFNETMKMGEFNPSALAKNSNLEKLGSFCDFSLMVEECVDVIDLQKILPEYMQQPRDLADKVIWYVVNYMQDSLGYKMSSYEDIYKFYTKMEEDYFGIPTSKIPRSSIVNDTLNIQEDEDDEDNE